MYRFWGFFFAILIFSFSTNAYYDDSYGIGLDTDSPLNLQDVVQILDDLEEKSLVALLQKLKEREPALFRDYVLMFRSRSLQSASFLNPRALLVGRAAHLVMSFNGHPEQHGYNQLEVMSYFPEEQRFEFREIAFGDNTYTISRPNPSKCLNCHQSSNRKKTDPRPNWEPYNVMPGAYVSIGHFSVVTHSAYKKDARFQAELSALEALEDKKIREFLANNHTSHQRYQFLEPMVEFKLPSSTYYFTAPGDKIVPNNMPTRITHLLLRSTLERVARLIKETPIFEQYKETLVGALRCEVFYMPAEVYQWHKDNYLRGKEHSFRDSFPRTKTLYGGIPADSVAEAFSLIFEPHGIDTSDWSMDFGTAGLFAANNRFGGPRNPQQDLLNALKAVWGKDDPLLKTSCKDLAAASFEKMKQISVEHLPQVEPPSMDKLLKRCASCHSDTNFYMFNAPIIAFDQPHLLASQLDRGGYPRGTLFDEIVYRTGPHALFNERMPADGYLPSAPERKALIQYLKELN